MPTINELQTQIDELKEQKEEINVQLDETKRLLRDHAHQGSETLNIQNIIKLVANIDAKKYKVAGTDGKNATATVRNSAGDGTCTIIFTNGIVTGGTCFP